MCRDLDSEVPENSRQVLPEGQAGAGNGDANDWRARFQKPSAQAHSEGRDQNDRDHTGEHYVQPALKLPLLAPFEHAEAEYGISRRRSGPSTAPPAN